MRLFKDFNDTYNNLLIQVIMDNILLCADSYKISHHLQYPPDTRKVYSYFESRGGKFDKVLFFGLQYILKKWLVGKVVTEEKIQVAKSTFKEHFGQDFFNEEGWRYILEKHGGHLPLRIKAVAEGTLVPCRNVLFTVENTDPKCYWLTNYLETLLVEVWYPVTVATNSFYQKKVLHKYLRDTSENTNKLPFQLHDFGFRGCSTVESAMIGGLSHLVNFKGTDTIAALVGGKTYYRCDMAGYSIPAAEHSTITSWGRDGEEKAFRNMLNQFQNSPVSVVSDSYNVYEVCEKIWGEKLKDEVMKRGKNFLVIRPDSGDPATTVVKVLEILGKKFGTKTNSKGYKQLPDYLRLIQGDGISYDSLGPILESITKAGWSSENLTFGSGGALLQRIDRDTQKCAFKCSFAVIGDRRVSIFKDPVDDKGKKSKKGKLKLRYKNGVFQTVEESQKDTDNEDDKDDKDDLLKTVYENGVLKKDFTFEEVRKLADECFVREVK